MTLDDLDLLEEATLDPSIITRGDQPVTIDEVQRAPDLLLAVKRSIDENRRNGRFLLTGSTNLHMMKGASESLAGRASYLVLRPMTVREQRGEGACGVWERLATERPRDWTGIIESGGGERVDWRDQVRKGGFPTPAVHMKSFEERSIWFDGYIQTYVERDLQQLSSISSLPDFRRLMRAAGLRLGQILNQSEIARDVGISQPTAHRYLNLLETSHLIVRLEPYSVNRTKRLIKSPKLFWADTGLGIRVSGSAELTGFHLENLVLLDLLTWSDARSGATQIHFWRTVDGVEVDFVVESDHGLLPIEIKSSSNVRLRDTTGIRTFLDQYPDRSSKGLILHDGALTEWIHPDVLAVPWWRVL
jgi:predicted AAA+ superfamily ATPase